MDTTSICRLCLRRFTETMEIFSEQGNRKWQVASIVAEHFLWFQPKNDDPVSNRVCYNCWWKIENFHVFYLSIEEAQKELCSFEVPGSGNSLDAIRFIEVSPSTKTAPTGESFQNSFDSDCNNELEYSGFQSDIVQMQDGQEVITLDEDINSGSLSDGEHSEESDSEYDTSESESSDTAKTKVRCEGCDKSFPNSINLRNHIKSQCLELQTFKCDECPKQYTSQHLLDKHQLIHIPVEQRQFFTDALTESLVTVISKKKKKETKTCRTCGEKVSRKDFGKHKRAHAETDDHKVKCLKCNVWLKSKYTLKSHMKVHSEASSKYNCKACGQIFLSKLSLQSHMRDDHKEDRLYECNICNKKFKKDITLKEHMSTHTGERLYSCPHCPKTFNWSANMHAHKKKAHPQEWERSRKIWC